MYNGPQQGQFWQQVWEAFFLNGQCSWMNCVKHLNLRLSIKQHFPGFQSHFFVFVVQAAHAVCGAGKTWGDVSAGQS